MGLSWTLHSNDPAPQPRPPPPAADFYKEILPQYFYYVVCNFPILYWQRKLFGHKTIQGNFIKMHILF